MSTCRWCGASVADNFCVKCHALNLSFTQPCLLGLYGPYQGKPFYVPANGLRVGRAQDQNQFVIDDPELSRQHAVLSLEAHGAVRMTSKGQNGTFVNGPTKEFCSPEMKSASGSAAKTILSSSLPESPISAATPRLAACLRCRRKRRGATRVRAREMNGW
jgi:hypothetical protein